MSFPRVRFFTILQGFATVVILASLALPVAVQAREKNSAKTGRKAQPQLVVRKKSRDVSAVAKTKDSRRSNAVSAKARRETDKLARQSGNKASTRLAKSRNATRDVPVAKTRADRSAMRLVAHHRAAPVMQAMAVEPRSSNGERMGLRSANDPLDLNSSVALVVDQQTNEVLFSKNDAAVLPIASLTKLMTGLVVTDANLPLDEQITISSDDIDTLKGSRSRLAVGTTLTRREMMHLALMSSENRAAHALGRTYPGGLDQFVRMMNAKAREIGMRDTHYVDPTGLSSQNQSSARDLATLVSVAYHRPILRSLSTSPSHQLDLGTRTLEFRNSNGLIRDPEWDIGLQKTGYISEAGRCLVMQARVAGRQLIMVFLDATGKLGRAQDAERVKRWVEVQSPHQQAAVRPQG
ncbi:D-alanyl-D-alanine endopeptidase [Hydrogenophaga sp. RWCD_12]|uniref:D-alanyl-D-alanine endopeptidase n=1 Tax=Hydrogenophaga sp. RWCD_12 TaxID=3391190 RepID=UPI0039850363